MYKTIDFLGINIYALNKKEIIDNILEFATRGKHKFITYVNAHCINVSFSDFEYRKILKQADLVYAGGMGIVWASKFFCKPLPIRANILDSFDSLLKKAIEREIRFYFLGNKSDIVQKTVENLKRRFPQLKIAGFHQGYFDKDEEKQIINEINTLKPNILMIGMGVPIQEKWVYKHLNELDINLCWAVGGAFGWLSGRFKRAPEWMIKFGLEWLHRLFQEPKRLWKRYLIGNFIFILHILMQKIKNIFSSKKHEGN